MFGSIRSVIIVCCCALAALTASVPGAALADDPFDPHYRENDHRTLNSELGFALEAGGGVYGFIDPAMRDVADVGGLWNARAILGTRTIVGVEVAYVGTASGIQALGLDDSAVLVAQGAEGAFRFNLMHRRIEPYVFLGVGFKHYQLMNVSNNTSSVENSEDVVELPVGGGLDYHLTEHLNLTGRLTVRAALDHELVGGGGRDAPQLHTLAGDVRLGWMF